MDTAFLFYISMQRVFLKLQGILCLSCSVASRWRSKTHLWVSFLKVFKSNIDAFLTHDFWLATGGLAWLGYLDQEHILQTHSPHVASWAQPQLVHHWQPSRRRLDCQHRLVSLVVCTWCPLPIIGLPWVPLIIMNFEVPEAFAQKGLVCYLHFKKHQLSNVTSFKTSFTLT